jgi:hypothetical protein
MFATLVYSGWAVVQSDSATEPDPHRRRPARPLHGRRGRHLRRLRGRRRRRELLPGVDGVRLDAVDERRHLCPERAQARSTRCCRAWPWSGPVSPRPAHAQLTSQCNQLSQLSTCRARGGGSSGSGRSSDDARGSHEQAQQLRNITGAAALFALVRRTTICQ